MVEHNKLSPLFSVEEVAELNTWNVANDSHTGSWCEFSKENSFQALN